jgi:hypothetical protein|tara:strand:- start:33207 stop:33464 length:258 start_codon:yes stop_codon:yes gene_type:complete
MNIHYADSPFVGPSLASIGVGTRAFRPSDSRRRSSLGSQRFHISHEIRYILPFKYENWHFGMTHLNAGFQGLGEHRCRETVCGAR